MTTPIVARVEFVGRKTSMAGTLTFLTMPFAETCSSPTAAPFVVPTGILPSGQRGTCSSAKTRVIISAASAAICNLFIVKPPRRLQPYRGFFSSSPPSRMSFTKSAMDGMPSPKLLTLYWVQIDSNSSTSFSRGGSAILCALAADDTPRL